jgi:hypothetical protein
MDTLSQRRWKGEVSGLGDGAVNEKNESAGDEVGSGIYEEWACVEL